MKYWTLIVMLMVLACSGCSATSNDKPAKKEKAKPEESIQELDGTTKVLIFSIFSSLNGGYREVIFKLDQSQAEYRSPVFLFDFRDVNFGINSPRPILHAELEIIENRALGGLARPVSVFNKELKIENKNGQHFASAKLGDFEALVGRNSSSFRMTISTSDGEIREITGNIPDGYDHQAFVMEEPEWPRY